MKQYLELVKKILDQGEPRSDRTGVGTKSIFGTSLVFDLTKGFPAVTTKKLAWKAVVSELLWFLEGSTNERRLCEILHGTRDPSKRTIWTDNFEKQGKDLGYTDGDLGPVYGKQWRNFNGVDQIANVINEIKTNPTSRRLIGSAWNPKDIPAMALPPCHLLFQFFVSGSNLDAIWYQRSIDVGIGLPFNIASYALLTHIIASITGLTPRTLKFFGGDTHIYNNQIEALQTQVRRVPLPLPQLKIPKIEYLEDLKKVKVTDFVLENYTYHEPLKMKMAV